MCYGVLCTVFLSDDRSVSDLEEEGAICRLQHNVKIHVASNKIQLDFVVKTFYFGYEHFLKNVCLGYFALRFNVQPNVY